MRHANIDHASPPFMAGGKLPLPHQSVVFQTVSDGAVLLNPTEEVYYGLNSVGVRIWQLLPAASDLDDLCARLGMEYPEVEPEVLRTDAVELIEALRLAGLVVARA
jgi:Coenzyme PQQ synthesis protein D (PqqD)